MLRRSVGALQSKWAAMKAAVQSQLDQMPEVVQLKQLKASLHEGSIVEVSNKTSKSALGDVMKRNPGIVTEASLSMVTDAALLTFLLHVESRAASLLGEGFYTIGPGGEELLGVIGLVAGEKDPMALHYRHLAVQIARRLRDGQSVEDILLARARGFCVSSRDPVTGGAHCALGGEPQDYIVTSTLASQTCPALGRALGGSLAHHVAVPTPFERDFVSFVSLGDGSLNNGHYLSGENLASFASFRGHRVPLLTCVTDNGISISFKNHGYVEQVFSKKWQCKVFRARGDDVGDLWLRSHEAFQFVRSSRKPAVLLVSEITRRFGHAATDRQAAYLSAAEIKHRQSTCMLRSLLHDVVAAGVASPAALLSRLQQLEAMTAAAFDKAHQEPKLTSRAELVARVAAPLLHMPLSSTHVGLSSGQQHVVPAAPGITGAAAQVMRKHMTKVFDDAMHAAKDVVYIGEDVIHGGYYMVTDGLHKKFSQRVQDFPPDETSLVGVGMGYSQAGLLPIVEIPYAKYLDCAMDMFTEACIMNWLSNGKQRNGMIFRLQGFGRGVFGGNYHTHNMLHIPPGLDVVCYSNGRDYSRGMRYALQQARAGRVAMFVDCTELLNLREVEKGVSWEMAYTPPEEYATYDDVFSYASPREDADTLIVTYGSGVVSSLQAQRRLSEAGVAVDICDCPLLSAVPQGLVAMLRAKRYRHVLFADICKEGQHPLASHMVRLINEGVFDRDCVVRCAAAQRTYNPLGTVLTFLSTEDICSAVTTMRATHN